MGAPIGGELAIYDSPVRRSQMRVAVQVDRKVCAAGYSETFAALDRTKYSWQVIGGAPLTDGDLVNRSWGIPPFEYVVSDMHMLPQDPTVGWTLTISATFMTNDPKYLCGFGVHSVEQEGGVDYDPLRVYQIGEAHASGTTIGRVGVFTPGQAPDWGTIAPNLFANDIAPHDYVVQWDPTDSGGALKITLDGDLVQQTDGPHPNMYSFFVPWFTVVKKLIDGALTAITPLGTKEAAVELIRVHSVDLVLDAPEVLEYPAWTTAPAGGHTIHNAPDRERFAYNGGYYAIVPNKDISRWNVKRGKALSSGSFSIDLEGPADDRTRYIWLDPSVDPHDRVHTYWWRREVIIDTRVAVGGDDDVVDGATAWRRLFFGTCETFGQSQSAHTRRMTLNGRSSLLVALRAAITRATIQASGTVKGANQNFSFTNFFDDLLDLGQILTGRDIARLLHVVALTPRSLNDGGTTLLDFLNETAERIGHEILDSYSATDGDVAEFGRLLIHTMRLAAASVAYTVRGEDAAGGANVLGISSGDDSRTALGQVQLHLNTGAFAAGDLWFQGQPLTPVFPTWAFPFLATIYGDTIAYTNDIGVSTLTSFKSRENATVPGGLARIRWAAGAMKARAVKVSLAEQDFWEPDDAFQIDDIGYHPDAVYIVDEVEYSMTAEGRLQVQLTGYNQDFVETVKRNG